MKKKKLKKEINSLKVVINKLIRDVSYLRAGSGVNFHKNDIDYLKIKEKKKKI